MSTAKKILQYGPQTNGTNPVLFQWSSDSALIAVATENRLVYVLDKRGKKLKEVVLPTKGKILTIDWDKENEYLAILQEEYNFIYLWSPFTGGQLEQVESDSAKAKATWMKWSHTHPILVFGTDKGNLIFYNKKNKKKIPTMGKHSKRVISGDWNNEGLLITGSEDKIITVSNYSSQTLFESFAVKSEPRNIKWTIPKTDERDQKQRTIAAILNQKTLLLHEVGQNQKPPLQLMLEPKYGKITQYSLFGDGYIVLGFTEGYYAHISTHYKQLKDQVKSQRVFNAPMEALCTNNNVYKLAVAGENKVKIISMTDWKQLKNESIDLPKNCGKINKIAWSQNGQTLIISTEKGQLYGYLTSSLCLTSSYNELIAVLNSFTDVTILSTSSRNKGKLICGVTLASQPNTIHLGPTYLAMKTGTVVKFYQWLRQRTLLQGGEEVGQRDYENGIKKLMLNDNFAAVLLDNNKLILHPLDSKSKQKDRKFPTENDRTITQFSLTKHFLIMLDNTSRLKFYHIEDQNVIMEHKSDNPIIKIFPNKSGTKVLLQHQNGELNLFNSATEVLNLVKNVTDRVDNVVWDNENQNQFVIINGERAYSYIICKNNIFGNLVQPVNQILSIEKIENEEGDPTVTKVEKNVLTLVSGSIYYMSVNGTINLLGLSSHTFLENYKFQADSQEGHLRYFFQNLSLKRFNNSLIAAKFLDIDNVYEGLGRKALENLELDIALKAFQMGKNLSMVLTIQPFLHENQKNLLIGNIAMVLGKYDIAQQYYLKSTQPLNALDMRCDIQDWFVASSLAKNIAPHQQSFICKRLAIQTQSQGNNTEALKLYERSVLRGDQKMIEKTVMQAHNVQCFAGIARTSIKLGDIQRGFSVARELRDASLLIDIAVVCQNMKQSLQAAELYEKANMYQKAAFLYLQLKMFKQAAPLMQKIKSPKILIQFGKAKQSQNAFKQAEAAYEKAESWEDVVRINLINLDNAQKAKSVLRSKCTTTTIASMVANYCEKRGLKRDAIEFLIMAGRKQQAFVIAQTGQMDAYAQFLKDATSQERTTIAQYYEGKSMWDKAAKQYELANNPMKAVKLYEKAGQVFIPQMLDLVAHNKNQQNLTQEVLDYLMGEIDEQPKDPIHTYRLYRILGNYKNASKIAVTIATQEQETGGYKNAHQILFQTVQDIKKAGAPVPLELQKKMLILHSYMLAVKRIIKMKEHQDAAFLLNKVAKNISQFPQHAVNILTAAVVEAMKSDLKGLAYQWAVVVVRAEYRSQIPQNLKSRIENLARKPVKEENNQPKTPCPFCKQMIPEFQNDCPKCLNNIPFCIASGKHIVAEELSFCTLCNFPANYSYFKKMIENNEIEHTCPMCFVDITLDQVKLVGESGVQALKNVITTKEKEKDKEEQKK